MAAPVTAIHGNYRVIIRRVDGDTALVLYYNGREMWVPTSELKGFKS